LSLVVKSDKPVVLVGSMRPATATSADGPANLYNAVALAANPEARKGRGPMIVINDEIHYAREATKTNATSLDTFKSPNRGRAGVMNTGKAYLFSPLATRHTASSEFSVERQGGERPPRVDIVYSYANFGRDTIDYLVGAGTKGIVLAASEMGTAPTMRLRLSPRRPRRASPWCVLHASVAVSSSATWKSTTTRTGSSPPWS
jgi:L-asparaginase